jgi:hypothetical protein
MIKEEAVRWDPVDFSSTLHEVVLDPIPYLQIPISRSAVNLDTDDWRAGGSANASDTIYREVQRLQEAGKPVIACMGNVAASGGYYIAAPAAKIVAQPSTLTGSIGVITGKLNFDAALR